MDSKKNAEMSIFCKIGRGDVSFWWGNWTVLGAANIVPGGRTSKNTKVQEFIHEGAWMRDKLMGKVSESTVNTIQKIKINVDKRDYPIWLLEKTGEFTCKSAWQNLRRKGCGTFTSSRIWHKQIPFKISFFMLRLLQARIPTDDVVNMAVIWRKPEMGWVNFNVDGCCKGNPGTTGGGGMIKKYNGEMIKAFAEFYGQGNNNLAEAKAMLYGVKLCCNCGFSKVIVESDSMLIVNLVNQRIKPPWQLTQIIEQIREVTETGNFLFVHIFREGNAIVDHLAKLGESSKTFHIFNQVVSLPMKIRASLKLDQDNMPNFRFRQKKNQFTINDVTI
ncbi:uncharacterized protein LOC142171777 [Nicotiana tabacum]|uniref:Uncharacterized protein LOC142171777 n=1 Tax=Nicotiana tabacum TaxID=4097 RepID=A0AC58T2Z9_TOBAC